MPLLCLSYEVSFPIPEWGAFAASVDIGASLKGKLVSIGCFRFPDENTQLGLILEFAQHRINVHRKTFE